MVRLRSLFLPVFPILVFTGCNSGGAPKPETSSPIATAVTLNTGTWIRTRSSAPDAITGVLLLSDGSIMAQGPWITNSWYKLAPDKTGNYVDGIWSTLPSMSLQRLYYSSGVFPSGKVYILGGEYSGASGAWNMTGTGEIYDPVSNSWSEMTPFPTGSFGDDPSQLLPDGNLIAGYFGTSGTYLYHPATNSWSAGPDKLYSDRSDEETWVKLPDDSVLSYDIFGGDSGHPQSAQRYVPSLNEWVDAGESPVQLENSESEIGPAVLLPDNGKVFYVGATSNTALYTPPTTPTGAGSWEAGPSIPFGAGSNDGPAAVLPNGHVMFAAGATDNGLNSATEILDYDPVSDSIVVAQTPPELNLEGLAAYELRMLVLPTGQLLISTDADSQPWIFTPADSEPEESWRPTISGIVKNSDGSYTLSGTQLNGLDEGSSYGDDFENSTNYPIVKITDLDGVVRYARTFDWSSDGVATGNQVVSTRFSLPTDVKPGSGGYDLSVIANGIESRAGTFYP